MKTWKAFEEKHLNIVVTVLNPNHRYAPADRKTNPIIIYFTNLFSSPNSYAACCAQLCSSHHKKAINILEQLHWRTIKVILEHEKNWVNKRKDRTLVMVRHGDIHKVAVNLQPWKFSELNIAVSNLF